jgi:2-amino-4-hydroxy-6-hydroxymethyldihydropteridine diphosphokinase
MNPDEAIVIALGSNLTGGYGSSDALLDAALARFAQAGLPILRRSRWWRSTAWPQQNMPEYRNGVVIVEAKLTPQVTLKRLLHLETSFGRARSELNAPRTLDLDLIAHGRTVMMEAGDLTLPHPRAAERYFVMGPLAEIAPGWRHPVLDRTAADLALQATIGRDAAPL